MKNKDSLQRFLFDNAPIRGEIVHLNHSFVEIAQQHRYAPAVQHLLGEALVLANLLSAIVKFKGRLTIQFQGKGKLKLLLAQANQDLQMRGLVQVDGDITQAGLIDELKKGVLVIMMDPDASGKRYQGIVAWKGNSLAQSIEGYFRDSEQLLTRIWLAVDEKHAAGFLLQKMPRESVKAEDVMPEESQHEWEHLTCLTETITEHELLTLDTPTLLHRLYVEEDVRLFDPVPVTFRCTCSVQRGEHAILLLGEEEAEAELHDNQVIVVTCEFCNQEFSFDRNDVAKIFRQGGAPPSSKQIH